MSLLSKYETITNHSFQISIKKIFYQKIKSRIKYYSNFLEYKIIIKLKVPTSWTPLTSSHDQQTYYTKRETKESIFNRVLLLHRGQKEIPVWLSRASPRSSTEGESRWHWVNIGSELDNRSSDLWCKGIFIVFCVCF